MNDARFTDSHEKTFTNTQPGHFKSNLRMNFNYSYRTDKTPKKERHDLYVHLNGDDSDNNRGYGVLGLEDIPELIDYLQEILEIAEAESDVLDRPAYYPAGTVATATVMGVPNVTVFRRETEVGMDWCFSPQLDKGLKYSCASDREDLVKDIIVKGKF